MQSDINKDSFETNPRKLLLSSTKNLIPQMLQVESYVNVIQKLKLIKSLINGRIFLNTNIDIKK